VIRAGVLTLRDQGSRGERMDESGPAIEELLKTIGATVMQYEIIPDELERLKEKLIQY